MNWEITAICSLTPTWAGTANGIGGLGASAAILYDGEAIKYSYVFALSRKNT